MDHARKMETVADIATIIVAVLMSAVLIKVYLLPAPSPRGPEAEVAVGTSLKDRVPGVDWRKNGRTLVLAISMQCHFCKESTPFYRKLEDEVGKSLKTVAVLPQPVAEAQQFLDGAGVHVDQVKQAAMVSLGIRGTPTILLVNSAGVVTKMWVGKIQPEREQEVLTALRNG